MTDAEEPVPRARPIEALSRDELDRICIYNLLRTAEEELYFKDLHSRFLRVSAGLVRLFEAGSAEEMEGRSDFDFFTDEHARTAYDDEQQIIATGEPLIDIEELETWPDRPDSWVSTTKMPLRDFDDRIIGTFGISRDITRRVVAERELRRRSEELVRSNEELLRMESELRTVLETSPDAIAWYDAELRYFYVNRAAENLMGGSDADLIGKTNRELGHPAEFLAIWEPALRRVLASGDPGEVDYTLVIDGHTRWYQARLVAHREDDELTGVLTSTRDLTDLKMAEKALAHQAVHDDVTGLANRALLLDRLGQCLLRLDRLPGRIAVLLIDLDEFKAVNETLGHEGGDLVLAEVARRLETVSRRTDTVARFGGDEFVMLFDRLPEVEDVRLVAERVVGAVALPMLVDGREIAVTASLGIVVSDDPHADADELLRNADTATYQAKERGHGRYQFFDG